MQGTEACKPTTRLNGFEFFSAHGSRSQFSVTLHGLAIPVAHCVLTEGHAVSAFCRTICKCCPCPLDLPELNLSTRTAPETCCSAVWGESRWRRYKKWKEKRKKD